MTVTEKHYSKCSVFAFDFETRIRTISPLINRLSNEAALIADHVSIIDVPHWFLINVLLRVSFSSCIHGAKALVWFSCSQE